MTQEWEDILSEPIAGLQPDLPASHGGWRGVQTIEELSPRPQDPPATLPNPDLMLAVRRPVQPEETSPASAPPPPTLTEQLSLTWAARRQPRAQTVEETGPVWPEWEPPSTDAEPPEAPSQPVPAWKRPLQFLTNLIHPRPFTASAPASSPAMTPDEHRETAVQSAARWSAPLAVEAPVPTPVTRRPPIDTPPMDLTLAKAAPEQAPEPETGIAPALAASPAEVPSKAPVTEPARAEQKADRPLQRELPGTDTVKPRVQPDDEPGERVEKPFEPVPLVDRASPSAQSVEPELTENEKTDASDTGEPLSPVLRERMERLLDVPLRDVRIFRNSISRRATEARQADAVSLGNDVHLAPDRGEPSSPSGRALLAHELSHIAARRESAQPQEAEEIQAQALEHAIVKQPEPPLPARTSPVALEHRASPPRASTPVADAFAGPPSYSSVMPSVSVAPAAGISTGAHAAVATAPVDRILSASGAMATAPDLLRNDDLMPPTEDEKPEERDEAGFVDRVVDAVLRRLKRESALERERRGPFRSEIGG